MGEPQRDHCRPGQGPPRKHQPQGRRRITNHNETLAAAKGHNETLTSQPKKGLRVSTNLRAGGIRMKNHNETLTSQPKKGRKTRLSR